MYHKMLYFYWEILLGGRMNEFSCIKRLSRYGIDSSAKCHPWIYRRRGARQGFLLAYLGLTQGYILLPEYESSKGYADFYMMPDLVQPAGHSLQLYSWRWSMPGRDTSDADIALLKTMMRQNSCCRYADDGKVAARKGIPGLDWLRWCSRDGNWWHWRSWRPERIAKMHQKPKYGIRFFLIFMLEHLDGRLRRLLIIRGIWRMCNL